jgi:hypothetical protein
MAGTMKQASPQLGRKLLKLLPLLASDKDGEIIAAARAIVRALASEKFDIHDLASSMMVVANAEQAPAHGAFSVRPIFDELSHFERVAWLNALAGCDWLTPLEQETVEDVRNHVKYGIAYKPHWRRKRRIDELLARASAIGVRA